MRALRPGRRALLARCDAQPLDPPGIGIKHFNFVIAGSRNDFAADRQPAYMGHEITAKRLHLHGRSRMLQISFREKAPLISDPRLLYFLAHFDVKSRGFTDPVFLVPSLFFHKYALDGVGRGAIQLRFNASMEPNAADRWAQWALPQAELGPRVMDMLSAGPPHFRLDPKVEQLIAMRGTVWLRRPSSIVVPGRRPAA